MIAIRSAHEADAAAIQRIVDAAFAPLRQIYRPSPAQIANVATLTLERLVACEGEQLVGTVRFTVEGERLRVIGLAVDPSVQRRGVARALVEQLVAIALARGCATLALHTIAQTGNVPVFQRLGFAIVREQPDPDSTSVVGDVLIDTYMERRLGKSVT